MIQKPQALHLLKTALAEIARQDGSAATDRFSGLWCAAQFPETPIWDSRAQCTTP
jgi:hypothetical protein